MRRKGSNNHHFNQRIPADVKARARGMKLDIPVGEETVSIIISAKAQAVRLSLRAYEPSEVKRRNAQVAAYLEGVWRAMRQDEPINLTHKQCVALSRKFYEVWAEERQGRERTTALMFMPDGSVEADDEFVEPEEWEAVNQHLERLASADDAEKLEQSFGPLVDRLLLADGIFRIDPASRRMLLKECLSALRQAITNRKRHAEGDYSPDPKAGRFPEWTAPEAVTRSAAISPSVSLKGLVEDWWTEAKAAGRSVSTYESYRNAFKRLADFVGHDDAAAITPQNVVDFKDHRLAQGVSTKTVGDSDLAALRSVFQRAVNNLKLSSNPAEKVKVTRSKPTLRRSKAFTAEEARAILSHSLHHKQGRERPKTFAAKRWVPWLCAYTGARLGEIVQLRKQDLRQEGDMWVVTITPEAGTVKDKEAREVVLHAHLVELGFPAFVQSGPPGYLFLTPSADNGIRGVWKGIKHRVREFAREVVTDKDVAPNHGWRHLFKTLGREAGIEDTVLDAICGHAAKTIGGSYGDVTLRTKAAAMAKFPRFGVKKEV